MRSIPLLLLVACSAGGTPCEKAWWLDEDGDGFGGRVETWIGCDAPPGYVAGPEDCDDADPAVHPEADELCDGVDNDCNDAVDDDPPFPVLVWEDVDNDGFGDPESETRYACPGDGWSDDPRDCDDLSGVTYPGAEETCDFRDRNCDGHPTLGATDGETWYRDDDGDGYGRSNNPTSGCDEVDPGYSLNADDCDDDDDEVYPGAPEGVDDGVDADCDGLELCPWDGDSDGYAGTDTVFADLGCTLNGAVDDLGDCDDTDPLIGPDATEIPYNGIDEDCDPVTRDDDLDEDGFLAAEECDDWDPQSNPANDPPPFFSDIAAAVGMTDARWDPVANPSQCVGGTEARAGGAAVADYDGDGLLDVFLPRMYAPDRLYRQLSTGGFEEVGGIAGVDGSGSSSAALWVDIEGDGDLDLAVAMAGTDPNRLYVNSGGVFTDEAALRGFDLGPAASCANHGSISAADVDGDGDLDLHLTAWQDASLPGNDRARLLINDGTGSFSDETLARGLSLSGVASASTAFVDVDDDGDLDLVLAGDHGTSGLFDNDGAGGFTGPPTALSASENAAGLAWGDVDGDGDLDGFFAGIYDAFTIPCDQGWGCSGNRLFLDDGATFTDATDLAGVRDAGWGQGAAFADFDHDGDLDLIANNGSSVPGFELDALRLFANDGAGGFTDEACLRLADVAGSGRGVVPFDADDDGDLDLLLTFEADPPVLLENQGGEVAGNWLRLALDQPGANPRAVGAELRISPSGGGATWLRTIHANGSLGASGPPEAHVGVGSETTVDVEITWPDGAVQLEPAVSTNQVLTLSRSVP